jgi:hypothetical protein
LGECFGNDLEGGFGNLVSALRGGAFGEDLIDAVRGDEGLLTFATDTASKDDGDGGSQQARASMRFMEVYDIFCENALKSPPPTLRAVANAS